MRSWAAPVNCPHFSGIKQAVQTSAATSPDREEPQRSAIYRKTPRSQETGDGRCKPGERRVTNMWLKQKAKRGRNRYVLMYLSTHRWFVSQKHLQEEHTHLDTHTCLSVQLFLSEYWRPFIVDILTLIISNSCLTRTLIWPHFPHDSQPQQKNENVFRFRFLSRCDDFIFNATWRWKVMIMNQQGKVDHHHLMLAPLLTSQVPLLRAWSHDATTITWRTISRNWWTIHRPPLFLNSGFGTILWCPVDLWPQTTKIESVGSKLIIVPNLKSFCRDISCDLKTFLAFTDIFILRIGWFSSWWTAWVNIYWLGSNITTTDPLISITLLRTSRFSYIESRLDLGITSFHEFRLSLILDQNWLCICFRKCHVRTGFTWGLQMPMPCGASLYVLCINTWVTWPHVFPATSASVLLCACPVCLCALMPPDILFLLFHTTLSPFRVSDRLPDK